MNSRTLIDRSEKNELTEEAYRIIKTIRQMEASLEDHKPNDDYSPEDEDLKVTVPLSRCIKGLKEKHNAIAKIHRERFEQVKSKQYVCVSQRFANMIQSLSSHSSPIPPILNLPSSR